MKKSPPKIRHALIQYWRTEAGTSDWLRATQSLLAKLWEFLRGSTPWRLRQRYGDTDYDWDHRVNTTSAAVSWRDRLVGVFYSAYQPTDPALFREMIEGLVRSAGIRLSDFTFVDIGSGKGRTLLMASDYPFQRILGVELLPSLDRIARENFEQYKNPSQKCFVLESICADAAAFPLPLGPVVIYLFNPFPEGGLQQFLANLSRSLGEHPRPAYLIYHNPVLERVLVEKEFLRKIGGSHQYSLFAARQIGQAAAE